MFWLKKKLSGCKTTIFNGQIINIIMLNNDFIVQQSDRFHSYNGYNGTIGSKTTSTVHYVSRLQFPVNGIREFVF